MSDKLSPKQEQICVRDGANCNLCGEPIPPFEMSIDHIIPISKGGSNHDPEIYVTDGLDRAGEQKISQAGTNLLQPIFDNGKLGKLQTYQEIRERAIS